MQKNFFKIFFVAFFVFNFFTGSLAENYQTLNSRFNSFIRQAIKFESQGCINQANEFYLKAQKIFPDRYEAKFGLAKTYGWLHNNDLALKYYNDLIKKSPNNVALLEAYANFLRDNKDYSSALELYDKLIKHTKDDKYRQNIAEISFLQGNYTEALELYSEIYNKNHENQTVQKALAFLYFIQGNFNESVRLYQSYLSKVQDSEAQLYYAKSLFYSGNPQAAQTVLEDFIKICPGNADALETLGEVYVALNQPEKAIIVLSDAIVFDPQNIKAKILLANAEISLKNYDIAKNLLLDLAILQPNNPQILEPLGDLSFYASDFRTALNYYQSIEGFNENNRLIFKIAQSNQYIQNLDNAEELFKKLLCVPEYAERAQMSLAEIELTRGHGEKARRMLLCLLSRDPNNAFIQKAIAATYVSTGENFKAIDILKQLPPDNDVNYNLAKAYYGIDRPDKALPLLENNPQPNAQILGNDIRNAIRPTLEPVYSLYHETGNANALKYQKFGGRGYFYPVPNMRILGGILPTRYSSLNNAAKATGTLYLLGLEGRPLDRLSFINSVGIEAFSYKQPVVLGTSLFRVFPNDYITWNFGYLRALDEIDSFMSAAGVVPQVGPFANQLVGRIVDNKFIVSNVAARLPYNTYAYAGYNLGFKEGSNSPANPYQEIPFGFGKVLYSDSQQNFLNQIQTGYDFFYTSYKYDRSGFVGADLNFFPIGSDGISPFPTATNPGVGGYFSPLFFISNRFSLNLRGNSRANKVKYLLGGFIGNQTYKGAFPLAGVGTGGTSSLYYGAVANLRINDTGRVGLNVDYWITNYRKVLQQLLWVNLILRF